LTQSKELGLEESRKLRDDCRKEYELGKISLKKLAKKHNIPETRMVYWARHEEWACTAKLIRKAVIINQERIIEEFANQKMPLGSVFKALVDGLKTSQEDTTSEGLKVTLAYVKEITELMQIRAPKGSAASTKIAIEGGPNGTMKIGLYVPQLKEVGET